MQQENQFFRVLFDEAPLPYQSLDTEGRLLTVNHAWQQELGYEKHEVLGRWFGDFVCSEQRDEFRVRFAKLLVEGRIQGAVWQMARKDGTSLHVSFSGRAVRDENKRALRVQCLFFDLGKRSEDEEQLRRSEQLRMAFMESAGESFLLYDEQLRLIYVNQAGARMLEAPREELIGKTMLEISPELEREDRYAQYQRVLQTGEPFRVAEFTLRATTEERRFASYAFKVDGKLGIIVHDVTEAKLLERQLREAEAGWRSMAEGSPDYVMILDQALRIEYINLPSPTRALDTLIGSSACSCVEGSQREFVCQILQEVLRTGESATFEAVYLSPDGVKNDYESRAAPRVVDDEIIGLIVASRDITKRKVSEVQIERLLQQQTSIAQLAVEFGHARSLLDIYRMVYQYVSKLMDVDVFIISRFDSAEDLIRASYVVSEGSEQDPASLPPIVLASPGMGVQSKVIRTGEPVILSDLDAAIDSDTTMYSIPRKQRELARLKKGDDLSDLPQSALLVPMKIRSNVIGVMQVQCDKQGVYHGEESEWLTGLASITAVAVENRHLLRESQASYEGIIRALAKAIELRDPYTSQHQEGVARIALRIAEVLNLPGEQARAIELAAHIHDIGKVVIPAEILSKPSELTGAQMSIVRSHVEAAHDVLADIDFPWPIDEIVVQHHERMDGSGYPHGIRGDELRLEARILAVADIADAMMSHRPYRPAFTSEEALAELQRLRGSALDPTVVDACVAVISEEDVLPSQLA